ncbi:MAG TPA: type VI secretion system protein TssA [Longimicrobium sp.]|nr:type VI secretion system protein TssA [Longimicrobium sp.]
MIATARFPADSPAGLDERVRSVLAAAPAPADLRADGTWARIQEALREDDPALPQGIWEKPLKRADPRLAATLALDALEAGAGDLQVAGWLAQAWTMSDGFAGAGAGIGLVLGLCEGGWDALRGAHDPEVLERPFAWMATHLPRALARVELTRAAGGGAGLTWAQREAALHRHRVQGAAGERPGVGEATPDEIDQAAARTPAELHARAVRELDAVIDAVERLHELLRRRWQGPSPSLQPLTRRAAEIRAWVQAQLGRVDEAEAEAPRGADDPAWAEYTAADDPGDANASPWAPPAGPPIRSRDEAYALLEAAAGYLGRTEPHSPTPWLVRRAVGWGGMELGELLETLIDEGYDLKSLRLLLGMAGDGRS